MRWSSWLHNRHVVGYSFIFPFLFGFFALTIFPMGLSLFLSMTHYNLLSSPRWAGLANYTQILTNDDKFWQSLKVTWFYVLTGVPIRLAIALVVAVLLAKAIRFSGIYRTALYVPSLIGGSVAVSVMWKQLFGNEGAINSLLASVGLPTNSWLGNPDTAIWTIILLFGWQFGAAMIIFLAGIKNIPVSYYEAAEVDGANGWHKFWRITVPQLTPLILFNLIMQMINAFMAFTPSFIITGGGPLDSTLLYILYMYQRGFMYFEMGYASALAWILLIIIGLITALVFKSSTHWVHYEAGGDK